MTLAAASGVDDALAIENRDLLRHQAFIDGRWVGDGARTFAVTDPADESVIAQVEEGDETSARAALEAAVAAFASWRNVPMRRRARLIRDWGERLLRHREDMARIISWEQGKPLRESRGEVDYAASYLAWFADLGAQSQGEVIAAEGDRQMLAFREPVGVVAAITPWNFPLAMLARKAAPALVAGCTMVAKPAEDTPLTALAFAALAQACDAPPGIFNVVPASREAASEVSRVWMEDARVRKVSFTGSTEVGRLLAGQSARTLKRLSLELGGDAPFIVFADANIERAVADVLFAKFRNAGQACIAANRLYIEAPIFDAFCAMLVKAADALKIGAARDGEADLGPLIHRRAALKADETVARSVEAGATVLTTRTFSQGNFRAPLVIAHTPDSLARCRGEIFAPIAAVCSFESEAEAIAAANDTPYGLAGYVHTSDSDRAWRMAHALECGMVGLNDAAISNAAAPFGGVKQSGYGREGSAHGMDEYIHLKYVSARGRG